MTDAQIHEMQHIGKTMVDFGSVLIQGGPLLAAIDEAKASLVAAHKDAQAAKEASELAQANHNAFLEQLQIDADAHRTQVLNQHALDVNAAQAALKDLTDQIDGQRDALATERAQHEATVAALKAEQAQLQDVNEKLKAYAEQARAAVATL